MNRVMIILLVLVCSPLVPLHAQAPDFKIEFGKVARRSVFQSETRSIWGGSLVKGEDGLYHMYYSRWPKPLGWVWVSHSEVAHAVSKSPFGPFQFRGVALPPRGAQHWDGLCTHNPTVHKFDGKYYLYYMGNTGDGKVVGVPGKEKLNWLHRNNQRIGVAVAKHPAGPWKRFDRPVLDISSEESAPDSLMTSNPSVCRRPNGGYLMVYKAVGKHYPLPQGGPVVHCIATSDSPTGPFKKHDKPIFTVEGERFPAEDPYIWYQDGKYRAIVKRMKYEQGKRLFSLVQYDSSDGFDWQPAKFHHISDRFLTWEDGQTQQFTHLERPQVYIENGQPRALLCAADSLDENKVRHSFNVQIPLRITKASNHHLERYQHLCQLPWQEVLYDTCTENWRELWTLDGLKATITHSEKGMDFRAGPIRKENASHAVLWTKESFAGDIRLDYEYTRTDEATEAVTILYLQATGSGAEGYDADISLWADKRQEPAMKLYFNHMNTLHVSYAAFGVGGTDPHEDYIRARRYMPEAGKGLKSTDLAPDYFRTGLFKTGVSHRITVIKKGSDLFMHIRNHEQEKLCHWKTNTAPPIVAGRIGLRHMWTRAARYRNFRVSQLDE